MGWWLGVVFILLFNVVVFVLMPRIKQRREKTLLYEHIANQYGMKEWFTLQLLTEKGFSYAACYDLLSTMLQLYKLEARLQVTREKLDFNRFIAATSEVETELGTDKFIEFFSIAEFRCSDDLSLFIQSRFGRDEKSTLN